MVSGTREIELPAGRDHDRRVVIKRLALVASALAMIATSAPPEYDYTFGKEVAGPPVALTGDNPQVTYLVTVRVTGTAPNGAAVRDNPVAAVSGDITVSGASSSTFVNVSLRSVQPSNSDPEINALTSFGLSRGFSLPS